MSKEDWVRCYELAKDNGLTDEAAIQAATEGAAYIESRRIDAAREASKEGGAE